MVAKATAKQRGVLKFIARYLARNYEPPTLAEIAEYLGSKNHAAAVPHLLALEKKGLIKRRTGYPRSIRIVKPAEVKGRQPRGRTGKN